jgi:hypothetical protein
MRRESSLNSEEDMCEKVESLKEILTNFRKYEKHGIYVHRLVLLFYPSTSQSLIEDGLRTVLEDENDLYSLAIGGSLFGDQIFGSDNVRLFETLLSCNINLRDISLFEIHGGPGPFSILANILEFNRTLLSIQIMSDERVDQVFDRFCQVIVNESTFERLSVTSRCFTDNQITKLLEAVQKNKSITRFKIAGEEGSQCLSSFVDLLNSKHWLEDFRSRLKFIGISPEMKRSYVEALTGSKIETIELPRRVHDIGVSVWQILFTGLPKSTKTLILDGTRLCEESLKVLSSVLPSYQVKHLSLIYTIEDAKDAAYFAQIITNCPSLQTVAIQNNPSNAESFQLMKSAFRVNSSISKFSFGWNENREEPDAVVIDFLEFLCSCTELFHIKSHRRLAVSPKLLQLLKNSLGKSKSV